MISSSVSKTSSSSTSPPLANPGIILMGSGLLPPNGSPNAFSNPLIPAERLLLNLSESKPFAFCRYSSTSSTVNSSPVSGFIFLSNSAPNIKSVPPPSLLEILFFFFFSALLVASANSIISLKLIDAFITLPPSAYPYLSSITLTSSSSYPAFTKILNIAFLLSALFLTPFSLKFLSYSSIAFSFSSACLIPKSVAPWAPTL